MLGFATCVSLWKWGSNDEKFLQLTWNLWHPACWPKPRLHIGGALHVPEFYVTLAEWCLAFLCQWNLLLKLQTTTNCLKNSLNQINNKNKIYLCVGIISIPCSSQRLLSTKIPHNEVNVLPNHLLHIWPNRRRCVNNFIHQELIKNCSFPCIVQSNQNNLVFCNA